MALAEKYQKLYPHDARFKALYANLLGLKIALSPLKATTLASDMLSSAREAYKMAPDDSWVSILYGNILFYMPGMFGGDKAQGLSCYQHARQGMEKNLSANSHNWLYVQLLVTIGVVNEKNEHYEQIPQLCLCARCPLSACTESYAGEKIGYERLYAGAARGRAV